MMALVFTLIGAPGQLSYWINAEDEELLISDLENEEETEEDGAEATLLHPVQLFVDISATEECNIHYYSSSHLYIPKRYKRVPSPPPEL